MTELINKAIEVLDAERVLATKQFEMRILQIDSRKAMLEEKLEAATE